MLKTFIIGTEFGRELQIYKKIGLLLNFFVAYIQYIIYSELKM